MRAKTTLFLKNSLLIINSVFVLILLIPSKSFSQTTTTFNTPGATTWTAPSCVTTVTVSVWGGGGGGADRLDASNGGEGGGGGGFSRSVLTVTPGTSYSLSVGAGGTGGKNNTDPGLPGGNSWFWTSTTVMAEGGKGGIAGGGSPGDGPPGGGGGPGGLAANGIGDLKYSGGEGGGEDHQDGGGGGASGGSTGNGGNGEIQNGGGNGGTAAAGGGGGNGGGGSANSGSGGNGSAPGGGGGGSDDSDGSVGGDGGNGRITVTYVSATTPTMTSANTATICSGGTVNIVLNSNVTSTYTWIASNNANTTGESTTSQSGSPLNNTIVNSTAFVQTVTYTVVPTSSPGGCVGTPQEVNVTVNPAPTMSSTNVATICSGASINISLFSDVASTYTWIAGDNTSTTGESTTIQSTSAINNTIINTTSATQTITYTVTPTSNPGGCTGTAQTVSVTVNPSPNMISTNTATICSGGTLNISLTSDVPSTYTWITNDNAGTTGESTTSQSGSPINNTINNTTSAAQTVVYTVTPTSNPEGCLGTSQTVNVTVNPLPQGSLSGNTICASDPADRGLLTWVATAGTGSFSLDYTGPSPVTEPNVTSGVTFSVNPTPAVTTTYTLTSVTDANGCIRTSGFTIETATITVTGTAIVINPTTPSSTATCSGTSASFSVSATGVYAYSWQVSTDGGTLWTTISAPGVSPVYSNYTTASLDISNPQVAQNGYRYRSIMDAACGLPDTSNVAILTVNPVPVLSSVLTAGTICTGTTFNYVPSSTTSDSSFTWSRATVAGITEPGTTGAGIVNETLTNPTANPIDVTYIYTTAESTNNCSGDENVVVTVNPDAAIGLTSPIGSDSQSVCLNIAITDITYAVTGGGTGVLVAGLPAGVSDTFIAGIVTISGTPSVSGVYTYTITTTGTCTQSQISGDIRVGISLSSSPGSNIQSVCKNTAITDITYALGGSGADATVIGLPSGVSGNLTSPGVFTISGTPSVEGTWDYTVTTTAPCAPTDLMGTITVGIGLVTPGTDTQSVCKSSPIVDIVYNIVGGGTPTVTGLPSGITGTSGPGIFTISGTPIVEGTFRYTVTTTGSCNPQSSLSGLLTVGMGLVTPGTDTQSVCKNSPIIDIVYNIVGGGTPTVTGLPLGITGTSGTGIFTISGTPSVEGTFRYTVTTTGSCTPQSSLSGLLTVGMGLVTPGTDTQSVCKNSPIVDIVYNIVGGGTPTVTGLPSGITGTSGPGIFTISGTPILEGTFRYTVTTTGSCNPQSSIPGLLTVGMGLVTPGTDTQSVCKSSPIVDIVYNIVGGGTPTVTGLPSGITGTSGPGIFTISGTPIVEGTFRYTVTTTGSCNPQSSLSGLLTVGMGLVTPGTDTQSVCKNSPIVDIVYNIVGGGTPTVTGLPAGITGTSGPGIFTINGTPIIEGTFRYTVTTTGSCNPQSSLSGLLTVGMGLVTPGTDTQSVCKNSPITNIVYTIVGGGTPTVTGLPSGVTGTSSPGLFTISGTSAIEGTYRYTVTTTGTCNPQSSLSGLLTIGIGLVTPGTDTQSVCKNSPITNIVYTIVGGDTPTVTGLPSGVTGTLSSGLFTISGTPTVAGTFRYTITTTGSCNPQSSLSGMLTVGIGLVTPGTNIQTVCRNTTITSIAYNVVGGGTPSTTGLPAGVTGAYNTTTGVFIISGTPSVAGVFNYTVTTTGTCSPQSSLTGTITVDEATITLTSAPGTNSQSLCLNMPLVNITYLIGGTGTGATVSTLPNGIVMSPVSGGVVTISGTPADLVDGTYTYTVTPAGGTCPATSSTFTITIIHPIASFTNDPQSGIPSLLVNFTNNSQNANNYIWYYGDGNTSFVIDSSYTYTTVGTFTVQLVASNNSQCPDTATATVLVYKLIIPNVFTPNDDGVNDIFTITSLGGMLELQVEIYNRWGTKIFDWQTLQGGWDGYNYINNSKSPDGTYYYILKAKDIGGKEYQEFGFITLLR